jgi:hypothetical protein
MKEATMRTLIRLLILGALFMPLSANALQLRWSTGTTELTFESARLCTLVVEAGDTLGHMPYEWRVLWATEGCPLRPVTTSPQFAAEDSTARVCGVQWPSSIADVAANQATAHFCSDGSAPASTAILVFDIPGGCRGKLQAVTIDPDDSTHILASAEVTFNGGASRHYPPTILRAAYTHDDLNLTVDVTGIGLDSLEEVALLAKNGRWRLPLTVTSQSENQFTATVSAAAEVPVCDLQIESSAGQVGALPLEAEEMQAPEVSLSYGGVLHDSHADVYPKDFAFIQAKEKFHIWYTRQNRLAHFDSTTRTLGHGTSTDLVNWTVGSDTLVLPVRNGRAPCTGCAVQPMKWDNWHVWAPSIYKDGMTYYMYYTGVSHLPLGDFQRIGLATSTDLINWTRRDAPVLTNHEIPWAAKLDTSFAAKELRDPFVMADPDTVKFPGQYIMYFTAADTSTRSMVLGYARSPNFEDWTGQALPMRATNKFKQSDGALSYPTLESPHLFYERSGVAGGAQDIWWLMYTTRRGVTLSLKTGIPYDTLVTDSLAWRYSDWFNAYQDQLWKSVTQAPPTLVGSLGDTTLQQWYASEYLKVPSDEYPNATWRHDYLAAANDSVNGIEIREISWTSARSLTSGFPSTTDAPRPLPPTVVGLRVISFTPGQRTCEFRIDSPAAAHSRLSLYDVQGRRLRTILNGPVAAGATTVRWDGRDANGMAVRSGIYFVRLESPFGRRVVRLPLVR